MLPIVTLLGISRKIKGSELSRGVGRDTDAANPRNDKTIAAFGTPGPCIGVELRAQLIDARDGHGAVGGDVLPTIGQCAGEISCGRILPDEQVGLEQGGVAAGREPSCRRSERASEQVLYGGTLRPTGTSVKS